MKKKLICILLGSILTSALSVSIKANNIEETVTEIVEETVEKPVTEPVEESIEAESVAPDSTFESLIDETQNSSKKIGWLLENGSWYYYLSSGDVKTGWYKENGMWYFFDQTGKMRTGWCKVDQDWYFLNPNGSMKTGWYKENETWYFLRANGKMKIGWCNIGGEWYFLNSNGSMRTGWYKENETWYFLRGNGKMKTGWCKTGGEWYYFNPNGSMKTGWYKENGTWYFLRENGKMKTGWLKVDSTWYFFNPSGYMVKGWQYIDSKWQYFTQSGVFVTSLKGDVYDSYIADFSNSNVKDYLQFTREDRVEMIGIACQNDYKRTGILASVSAAQCILESGYLESDLAKNANNCFGMKAYLSGNSWSSVWDRISIYTIQTKEHVNGSIITIQADFRKYKYLKDSIADHSAYLIGAKNGRNVRYPGISKERDYVRAVQIIKDGGYATDPNYVNKICNIIQKFQLTRFDES